MNGIEGVNRSDTDAQVRVLAFCRPETKNSIDVLTARRLLAEIEEAASASEVKALVLTGDAGNFSSGGHLEELVKLSPDEFAAHLRSLHRLALALHGFPRPLVAAVDGVCAGGAVALALAADAVVGTPHARFAFGFVRMGLVPDLGLPWLLSARVGPAQARRLLLEAEVVDGNRAIGLGLLDQLEGRAELLEKAVERACAMALAPAAAWRRTKSLFVRPAIDLAGALDAELPLQQACFESDEFRNAAARFLQRPAR